MTTVKASKERMLTNLLIKTLERSKRWPTIKGNADALSELEGIKWDAFKYTNVIQLEFNDVQLFVLQTKILEKENVKISNKFGMWLYYQNILRKQFEELVSKSKRNKGLFCEADFDCNNNKGYKRKCVEEIKDSIPFPELNITLLFTGSNLQDSVYVIDANDGNCNFL